MTKENTVTNHDHLTQGDIERIEKIIYCSADNVAVSLSRSFQRLEERIETVESRVYARIADVEDKIESSRQDLMNEFSDLKKDLYAAMDDVKGLREAVTG